MRVYRRIKIYLWYSYYYIIFLSLQKDSVRVRVEGFATLKKYIDEHISEHRDSFDPENIRDFIDMYLEAEKDEIERTSSLNRKFREVFFWLVDTLLKHQTLL